MKTIFLLTLLLTLVIPVANAQEPNLYGECFHGATIIDGNHFNGMELLHLQGAWVPLVNENVEAVNAILATERLPYQITGTSNSKAFFISFMTDGETAWIFTLKIAAEGQPQHGVCHIFQTDKAAVDAVFQ